MGGARRGESLDVYVYIASSKQAIRLVGFTFRTDPMQLNLV